MSDSLQPHELQHAKSVNGQMKIQMKQKISYDQYLISVH